MRASTNEDGVLTMDDDERMKEVAKIVDGLITRAQRINVHPGIMVAQIPKDTRKTSSDGVTSLLASQARTSCVIPITDAKGKPTGRNYGVDVIHRPLDAPQRNDAHCQIECDPHIANASRFKKLKEALARIATANGFVVAPS